MKCSSVPIAKVTSLQLLPGIIVGSLSVTKTYYDHKIIKPDLSKWKMRNLNTLMRQTTWNTTAQWKMPEEGRWRPQTSRRHWAQAWVNGQTGQDCQEMSSMIWSLKCLQLMPKRWTQVLRYQNMHPFLHSFTKNIKQLLGMKKSSKNGTKQKFWTQNGTKKHKTHNPCFSRWLRRAVRPGCRHSDHATGEGRAVGFAHLTLQ